MARGRKRPVDGSDGPAEDEIEGGRRCLVTRETAPRAGLIRFVVDPNGGIVPDLAEKLPGRGLWASADREVLGRAVEKRLFGKAAKRSVEVDPDLVDLVERLLSESCVQQLALARRAGVVALGNAKVREALSSGRSGLLLEAVDGAEDGVRRMRGMATGRPILSVLSSEELARPFGRDRVVHIFLDAGGAGAGLIARLQRDAARLSGLRSGESRNESASRLENEAETCIQGAAQTIRIDT